MLRIVLGVSALGALLVTYWVNPMTAWIVLGSSFTLVVAFEVVARTGIDPLPADEHLVSGEGRRGGCHRILRNVHHIDNEKPAQIDEVLASWPCSILRNGTRSSPIRLNTCRCTGSGEITPDGVCHD